MLLLYMLHTNLLSSCLSLSFESTVNKEILTVIEHNAKFIFNMILILHMQTEYRGCHL